MLPLNRTRLILAAVGLLALGGVVFWIASPSLALATLPFLLLAACPLSMLLMGHGHTMDAKEGHHAQSAAPSLADLPHEEQVRALRQEMVRMAWRQEELRREGAKWRT